MPVQLDHTIVAAHDNKASAAFLAEILGLPAPKDLGHFQAVPLDNGITLDFATTDGEVTTQHYAFAVSDVEFDDIYDRVRQRDLQIWADPMRSRPDEIRKRGDSRGFYFDDPSGHLLEVLTHPEQA
jgi:catechol 2,3-dioxygenase-like lactoylglutathione lyase family enzyme